MAGALVIKQIKPARLKEDAMRLALLNGMHKTRTEMLKDFEATTETWEHKVKFESAISEALGGPSVNVVTNDEIYNYVNNGTKPHPIFAGIFTGLSGKRALSFRNGKYKAKTKVRVIGSTPGGPTGTKIARPYVQHPGSEGRHFDEEIQKKFEPRFKRLMEEAMKDAAHASGHAIA